MHAHTKFTLLIIFLFCFSKIVCQNGALINVTTSRGLLFGKHFDQGNDTTQLYYGQADVFEGIPYLQAPIGPLRYQVKANQKYPVMVHIHGGGLITGDNHIGTAGTVRNFVTRGVVVVSIQYRLGFLGFFTTFTDDFYPNLGMLDQVEALRFVQEEISNFGGDPTRVTIFGESAGSASVSAHTYSPLSQNLFQQGIQESGTVLTCFEGALGPTNRNFEFAKTACNYTADLWNSGNYTLLKNCLMNMNINDGLNYHGIVDNKITNAVCWNMVQDNNFFPGTPNDLAKNRTNKPIIIGTNKDEWALWEMVNMFYNITHFFNYTKDYCEKTLAYNYANFLGNQTQSAIEVFETLYIEDGVANDDNLSWLQFMVDVGTSFFFTGFTSKDVELHLLNNNTNVYVYQFSYSAQNFWPFNIYNVPGFYPVPHGADLPFVFAWSNINQSVTTLQIADFFAEAWTNFAKTGKPSSDSINWTRTSSILDKMEYFDINQNSTMKIGYRTIDQIQFNRILPIFIGVLPPEMPDYNNGSIVPTPPLTLTTILSPKRSAGSKIVSYSLMRWLMILITQQFLKHL